MPAKAAAGTVQEAKLAKLRRLLRDMGSAVVAYSGGTDSTFLLKVAADALGDRVVAVTAVSATYPHEEHESASQIAASLGVRHTSISTDELENPDFVSNPPERCYYCKGELFAKLRWMTVPTTARGGKRQRPPGSEARSSRWVSRRKRSGRCRETWVFQRGTSRPRHVLRHGSPTGRP